MIGDTKHIDEMLDGGYDYHASGLFEKKAGRFEGEDVFQTLEHAQLYLNNINNLNDENYAYRCCCNRNSDVTLGIYGVEADWEKDTYILDHNEFLQCKHQLPYQIRNLQTNSEIIKLK